MMESSTVSVQKEMVPKHELVRIIILCLNSLGYTGTASILETESRVRPKSAELELLESQILDGKWNDCINTLTSLIFSMENVWDYTLELVFKQWLLECLHQGDITSALTILRKRVSKLGLSDENIQSLASLVISTEDIELGGEEEISTHDLRRQLLSDLVKYLPSPIAIPERRLEYLVESAVNSQIERCLYHNEPAPVCLYKDHCCDRDQLPIETVQILTGHKNKVLFVEFSHDGEYLASSSSDCTAIIWKVLENGHVAMLHSLQGHQKPVSFIAWSPDDTKLLTRGNADVVKLWDVRRGACSQTYGDHSFIVSSCAWLSCSDRFLCGSTHSDKHLSMWDCDGNEVPSLRWMSFPTVLDLAISTDGKTIVCVISERELRIVNIHGVKISIVLALPVSSVSFSDGNLCMINLNSQEIHIWDADELTDVDDNYSDSPMFFFGRHGQSKSVTRPCIGGWGTKFVASGSQDSRVYIWNLRNPNPIEVLCGHTMTVNCVSWNPTRHKILASASDDNTIRIWGSKTDFFL